MGIEKEELMSVESEGSTFWNQPLELPSAGFQILDL